MVAAAAALVVVVAVGRLYPGIHYPTDVIASRMLALSWLAVCWWVVRPEPDPSRADVIIRHPWL
ncbi:MAG: phosphatase PAP2 family protein [Saccharothrix sp.]|nr:phosphatase PAP2 family protein [Saccharothrix sp.]